MKPGVTYGKPHPKQLTYVKGSPFLNEDFTKKLVDAGYKDFNCTGELFFQGSFLLPEWLMLKLSAKYWVVNHTDRCFVFASSPSSTEKIVTPEEFLHEHRGEFAGQKYGL